MKLTIKERWQYAKLIQYIHKRLKTQEATDKFIRFLAEQTEEFKKQNED